MCQDSSYFNSDVLVGTGTSKLTTSVIHLANNNLDTLNYGARIVSLGSMVIIYNFKPEIPLQVLLIINSLLPHLVMFQL